jgi:hypothetical protein
MPFNSISTEEGIKIVFYLCDIVIEVGFAGDDPSFCPFPLLKRGSSGAVVQLNFSK